MEPHLGEIIMFGGNFAPVGFAFCNGQLLSIAEYDALYSLIGTTYGGDGQTTFALPNLQGRVPIHMGSNQGNNYVIGEMLGNETITLTQNQIPAHTHQSNGTIAYPYRADGPGNSADPKGNGLGVAPGKKYYNATADTAMAPINENLIQMAGGSQPHNNMQPFLCINFIICIEGIYPVS